MEINYVTLNNRPWVPMARVLMSEGRRFCVTNWDDAVDGKDAKTLIEEFKYLPPVLYPDREAYFFPVSA
jgi:hypothetical protein